MDSGISLPEAVRDLELSHYKDLGELCGKTFVSLKGLIRKTGIEIKRDCPDEEGFNRIVKRSQPEIYLGYECPKCKIVVGPPRIETEDIDTTRRRGVLEDKLTYYCRVCNKILYEQNLGMQAVD